MRAAPRNVPHAAIAVCICTYRRPRELARLLRALDAQVFPGMPGPDVFIVVVDNSPGQEGADVCRDHSGAWPVQYLVEPRAGISHARNTCLGAVPPDRDCIAMIDDDEEPEPQWLASLLDARARSGAEIVVGRTIPVFPPATPDWIAETRFFLKPQNQDALDELDPDPPAATCNVLLNASLLRDPGLVFDPALGLSGGEDKLLFQRLKQRGCRFAWAGDARVSEYVPAERARLSYMLRESYRRGWVVCRIKLRLKSRSAAHSVKIVCKLLLRSLVGVVKNSALVLVNLARGRAAWVPFGLGTAGNIGTLAGVLRIPNRHYRSEDT